MADTSYWFQQLVAQRDAACPVYRRGLTGFLDNWVKANGNTLTDVEVVRWDHDPQLTALVPAGFVLLRVQGWVKEFDVDLAEAGDLPATGGLA